MFCRFINIKMFTLLALSSHRRVKSLIIKSPVVHSNAVLAKLVAQEPITSATTPITTPTIGDIEVFKEELDVGLITRPKFEFISLDRLVDNCANKNDDLHVLKTEIEMCHKVKANSCEDFSSILKCFTNFQKIRCHLFDMASFESDLHAHLIENYEHALFVPECETFDTLQGNIFHTSTRLCSQNHIDKEKLKKKECSTVEEHNLVLQVKFQSR